MKKQLLSFFAAILTVLVVITSTLAGDEKLEKLQTPESAAQSYIEAMKQGSIKGYTKHMHPEALEKFRNMMLPIVEQTEKEDAEDVKEILSIFEGIDNTATLRKLSPEDFFISFYEGITKLQPGLKQMMTNTRNEIIGHVNEGDNVAHVVIRVTVPTVGASVSTISVISLQKHESDWRVLLPAQITGIANVIKQRQRALKSNNSLT